MGAKSTDAAEKANAVRASPRGCKGRSPLHKKTKNLPLPAGKSALRARVGGMGAEKQTKGKVGRRQRRQTPAGLRNATLFCFT